MNQPGLRNRGGSRGGQADFKWDDVKQDKHRENYIGASLYAAVGRWQKGKDLQWFTKEKKSKDASRLQLEMERMELKRKEHEALEAALGYKIIQTHAKLGESQLSAEDMAKAIKRGDDYDKEEEEERPEAFKLTNADKIKGIGFGGDFRKVAKDTCGNEVESAPFDTNELKARASTSIKPPSWASGLPQPKAESANQKSSDKSLVKSLASLAGGAGGELGAEDLKSLAAKLLGKKSKKKKKKNKKEKSKKKSRDRRSPSVSVSPPRGRQEGRSRSRSRSPSPRRRSPSSSPPRHHRRTSSSPSPPRRGRRDRRDRSESPESRRRSRSASSNTPPRRGRRDRRDRSESPNLRRRSRSASSNTSRRSRSPVRRKSRSRSRSPIRHKSRSRSPRRRIRSRSPRRRSRSPRR